MNSKNQSTSPTDTCTICHPFSSQHTMVSSSTFMASEKEILNSSKSKVRFGRVEHPIVLSLESVWQFNNRSPEILTVQLNCTNSVFLTLLKRSNNSNWLPIGELQGVTL